MVVPSSRHTLQRCGWHVEIGYGLRDHDSGPKFLGLGVGESGQLPARDPGRKPEIVLDLRARTRLASWGTRLDDQRIESLGRGVDGRGKARRPGADDDDIAHVPLVDAIVEAETIGELAVARALQDHLARTDHHGQLGR